MEQRRAQRNDLIVSISLSILSVAVFAYAFTFPPPDRSIGMRTFPQLLAGLLLALSVALIVQTLIRRRRVGASDKDAGKETGPASGRKLDRDTIVNMAVAVGAAVLFVVAVKTLGFLLTAFLFLGLLIVKFGERRPLVVLGTTVGLTAAIYGLFGVAARVPFPRGLIENLISRF